MKLGFIIITIIIIIIIITTTTIINIIIIILYFEHGKMESHRSTCMPNEKCSSHLNHY